ncbi:MAG TPA: AsmA family protein, partial [Rhizobiaceae bacterium]|nr:AsmA family protein [Rhizobiaceae bacterium]
MRRIVYAALTVLVVAVAALSALPLFVSSEGVRQQILDSAVSITGREMSFRGTPQITFNPFLGFELNDVVFDDPDAAATDAPFLRMERLQGRLDILPALTGRAEMSNYRFVRPQFNLRVYGDGTASWAFPQGRVWNVLNAARAAREATPAGQKPDLSGIANLQLGTVEIVDGTFNYDDRKTGRQETFTNFNGQLSWPGTSS